MKILDRYLLGEFLKKFGGILALFAIILLVKDILGELADLLSERPEPLHVLLFFVYRLPLDLIEVVPISVILGMMFSIGAMAKRKEILAIHACGVSYTRLALPVGIAIFLISLGIFYCNETVLPECWIRARHVEQVLIKKKPESSVNREKNITTKGKGDRFYTMKNFYSDMNRMESPSITDIADTPAGMRTIRRRLDAEWAELVGDVENGASTDPSADEADAVEEENRLWRFYNATMVVFDDEGNLVQRLFLPQVDLPMEKDLDRFLATNKRHTEMNFRELRDFVQVQGERRRGTYYLRLKTMMYAKLAFPLAAFVLGMIGYTFAVRSSIRSLVFEFGMAILCAVLWYAFFGSADRLGRYGVLPPFLAAWYGNILFFLFLLWRFRSLGRVPKI